MNVQRRNLLKALGLLGPAYYLSRPERRARAADPVIPTRILFFYTSHGTLLRQWMKPPAGASAATETNYDFGPILQPLAPFKKKMLVLEGLDMVSQYVDPITPDQGHIGGQTHALSAANRASSKTAGAISIDQFIAQKLNASSPVTTLPSLELSARVNPDITYYLTSWRGANSLVPALALPAQAYARVFPSGPPSSSPSQAQLDAAAAAARRKSVLDATLAEFAAVKKPLGAADRAKLDTHASLIRDLEKRLSLPSAPTTTCSVPDKATLTAAYQKECPNGTDLVRCLQDSVDSFNKLAVSALACDVTRVITYDMTQLDGSLFGVDDIHTFLHGMDDIFLYANDKWGTQVTDTAPQATDPASLDIAIKFYAGHAKILADLLGQLDAVIEPDGSTLLDHTMVLWCNEMGSPNHRHSFMNYVLAGGGAGGYLKTGRYLSFPRTTKPYNSNDWYPNAGLPHNNLFVSLANAMGLKDVTSFGNPNVCTGDLPQLRG